MGCSRSQARTSAACILGFLLCVTLFVDSAAAVIVDVGGSSGWTLGYDYKTWASTAKVRPGDSLFFKYDPSFHNVLLVSKLDYDACRGTTPQATYTSGQDYVKFTKAGTYYLFCGVGNHCAAGMKVAVTVR